MDAATEEMSERIKNRKFGSDAMLDERAATIVKMSMQFVTKIETVTKRVTTDSGSDEIAVKVFTEKDACLVTVSNWDAVEDKAHAMRTKIVPSLAQFKLDPAMTVVLRFFDGKGEPMRYEPSPKLQVVPSEAIV